MHHSWRHGYDHLAVERGEAIPVLLGLLRNTASLSTNLLGGPQYLSSRLDVVNSTENAANKATAIAVESHEIRGVARMSSAGMLQGRSIVQDENGNCEDG